MENNTRTTADSRVEQIRGLLYQHLNNMGRLFGGWLMQWIDEVAGMVATRHCGSNVTTAAIDSLVFKEPAMLGDMLVLIGTVTYTGNTSLEVRVDTYIEALDKRRKPINSAYLVFVSLTPDGKPQPVPQLLPQTDEEMREWEMGKKRSELRKKRRHEQY